MLKTHEISIGPVFRCFIGALGVLAIILGAALTAWEVQFVFHGELLRLFAAGFFLIILAGGVSLLRGAIRGRISVRSYHSKKKH